MSESALGFYRLPEVLSIIPTNKSVWYAGIRAGKFPQPVRISKRTVAWRKADIHQLVDDIEQGRVLFN